MHRVFVETACRPTENPSKVKIAILNLFPDARLEEGDTISGEAMDLERLAELFRAQRIRDSAREILLGSVHGNRIVFRLSKQAAFAGKVSFSSYSPLGDIVVTIEGEDIERLVDQVAPSTLQVD